MSGRSIRAQMSGSALRLQRLLPPQPQGKPRPQNATLCVSSAALAVAGFSLSALEELLTDNKRLASAEQQQQQQQVGEPAAAAAPAPEQQQLQVENEALRQQLKLSESLRRKGQKVLRELKQVGYPGQKAAELATHCMEGLLRAQNSCLIDCRIPLTGCSVCVQEFGALSRELILGSGGALEFAEQKNERVQAAGTPVAVADGLL